MTLMDSIPSILTLGVQPGHGAPVAEGVAPQLGSLPLLIPGLPLLGAVLAVLCAVFRVRNKAPAWIMVLCLAGAFGTAMWMYGRVVGTDSHALVRAFDWITFDWAPGKTFTANFSFYVDSLTCLWMVFVTGLAMMIALYASEYMSHDKGPGYCRFFFAFGLFVFSMACLVMADNLLLLYLGWEGVGLCSYLLIGYFYQKPSAVAAAKKAFIMNRIGDLGLALGILLTFVQFGSVEFGVLFEKIKPFLALVAEGRVSEIPLQVQLIAVLFTLGAFGKSAQIPLYVWLPDAMEGPTPVSALIHAATMVTAGVYLVARFIPFYQCSTWALPIVAWGGGLTALLAATIGMAQFDIKRIMAYSTVSQLGYMFAGIGVLGATSHPGDAGASAFHVFTHAFFKATLFLACGAVMHGFAGQLDLRKLSGVMKMKGWKIVGLSMLVGCLNLSGFPFTAGFFSKDMILGNAFSSHALQAVGWILLLTAGLTAYYTFRVFFRVFVGPKHYEPGEDLHAPAHDIEPGHTSAAVHAHPGEHTAEEEVAAHDFHPHPPGWAINVVLATLALVALALPFALHFGAGGGFGEHWITHLIEGSTGKLTTGTHTGEAAHATIFGHGVHDVVGGIPFMFLLSGVVGLLGITIAWYLHLAGRTTAAKANADKLLPVLAPIARAAQHKWYVDEFYDWIIVRPLLVLAHIFYMLDKFLIDGLVDLFGMVPRGAGSGLRPSQSGVLHGYAVGMACGIALLAVIALLSMM